jgi:Leucine Rich repeat
MIPTTDVVGATNEDQPEFLQDQAMRLPRVRVTVRLMMLSILIIGISLGWRIDKARRQADAVSAVQRLGGDIYFDYDLNLQGRYSPNARPPRGPGWLREILSPEYFRTPYTIWVRQKVTDSELSFLQELTELRTLHLPRTDVTDSGLSCLRSMPHLWGLDLMNCSLVGDASAREISGLVELKELYLNGTRFTDMGLACVRGKRELRVLFLSDLRVTDAGLDHLEGLTNLESLALNGTQVTDAGLVHMEGLTKLWQLGLNGTQVTDAGLAHLKGLTGLKFLMLDKSQVTQAGVAELQKSLPGTKISWGN